MSAVIIGASVVNTLAVPVVAESLSGQQIAQLAAKFVVRIDGGGGGSGFIVRRDGNRHTVLTNWHVVRGSAQYTVTTTTDVRTYPVASIKRLEGLDLAEIEFVSDDDDVYEVAQLSDDGSNLQGSKVFAYGWNGTSDSLTERATQIINGSINGFLPGGRDGYTFTMDLVTVPGMSGSPILNEEGKVIGVYGRTDTQRKGETSFTTFALGIPISTYKLNTTLSRPFRSGSLSATNNNFRLLYEIERDTKGMQATVVSVVTTADAKMFITGLKDEGIFLWRIEDGKLIKALVPSNGEVSVDSFTELALTPDGQILVSAGNSSDVIKVWNMRNGNLLRIIEAPDVSGLAITPDGRSIVASSWDDKLKTNTLKLWSLSDGKLLRKRDSPGESIIKPLISPNGDYLIVGKSNKSSDKGSIEVWRMRDFKFLKTISPSKDVYPFVISPDSQVLAGLDYASKTVKIWRINDGKLLYTLTHGPESNVVAISPDGKMILTGGSDGNIKIWQLTDGKLLHTFTAHERRIRQLAISSDSKIIVSANFDGVKVWSRMD